MANSSGDNAFPAGLEGESLITFIKYLTGWSKQDKILRMWAIFGDEMLLFMNVFQGEVIHVPPAKTLLKIKSYCLIYVYLKERDFSEESYIKASQVFKRRRNHLNHIVKRVESVIEKLKPLEDQIEQTG